MNFYKISTISGDFWIEASRASEAYPKAKAILGHDEYSLTRELDITWTGDPDLAGTLLTGEELSAARVAGIEKRGTSPFEDPRTLNQMREVLRRRGERWAAVVLGRDLSRRSLISAAVPWLEHAEAEILVIADEMEQRKEKTR